MTGKEAVRDALKYRGWSQQRLANEIGLGQTHVSGYLNNVRTEMRLDTFFKLMNAMGFEIIVKDKMGTDQQYLIKYENK